MNLTDRERMFLHFCLRTVARVPIFAANALAQLGLRISRVARAIDFRVSHPIIRASIEVLPEPTRTEVKNNPEAAIFYEPRQ